MPFIFKRLALLTSIAAAAASYNQAADDKPRKIIRLFTRRPAAELPHHQTNGQVTIGVDPYTAGDKSKRRFGKLNPYQYGILPVLIAIQNDSGQSIKMDGMKAEYVGPHGDRIEATPAKDVPLHARRRTAHAPPIGLNPATREEEPAQCLGN